MPAHNPPPLMPLFTPVLQTFQSQYGSSIFQQTQSDDHQEQEGYDQEDVDQYTHQPRLSDFQDGLNQDEQDRSHRQHQHQHYQHYHHHSQDEDDDEEDEEIDPDASSRRNLLYAGVGEASSSAHSSDGGRRGNNPYFQGNRSLTSGLFALNRPINYGNNSNARGGHGNPSLLRTNLDIGTDHEAPASLMIEMNRQHQGDDDSTGYWNFGDRARRRLQYKRPGMNAAELAMWKWVNVENLDNFLARVGSGNTGYSSFACANEQTAMLSLIMEFDLLLP